LLTWVGYVRKMLFHWLLASFGAFYQFFASCVYRGSLIKSDDIKNQLQLMAVNSKKWRDVESEELRAYLSTLHNGIITDENKDSFAGIDTDSDVFINFQRSVRLACAQTKQQEYQEKGDDLMAIQYATYLLEEERIAAQEKGMAIACEIVKLLRENVPVNEIAKIFQVSTREVEKLKVAL